DRGGELIGAERLDQELAGAGEHRSTKVVRLTLDRHHDHGGGRDVRGELFGRRDPVHAGHVDVHQDDVRPERGRHLDRLGAAPGCPDDLDVALEAEELREVIPGLRDVVDDQDLDAIGHGAGFFLDYFLSGVGIGTWTISGGRIPYLSTRVLRITPLVSAVIPASSGERRTRSSVPVVRANSMTSAWAGVRARISSFGRLVMSGPVLGSGWP